jgi:hypothetical protein
MNEATETAKADALAGSDEGAGYAPPPGYRLQPLCEFDAMQKLNRRLEIMELALEAVKDWDIEQALSQRTIKFTIPLTLRQKIQDALAHNKRI